MNIDRWRKNTCPLVRKNFGKHRTLDQNHFLFVLLFILPSLQGNNQKKKMTSRRKCLFWFLAHEERETTVVERCGGKSTPSVAAEAGSSVPHWAGSREQRRCCSVHLILIQSRTPAHAMVPNIFKGGPPSSNEAFRKHWEFCLLCYHKPKYVDNED